MLNLKLILKLRKLRNYVHNDRLYFFLPLLKCIKVEYCKYNCSTKILHLNVVLKVLDHFTFKKYIQKSRNHLK